jgi:hypothetical protein
VPSSERSPSFVSLQAQSCSLTSLRLPQMPQRDDATPTDSSCQAATSGSTPAVISVALRRRGGTRQPQRLGNPFAITKPLQIDKSAPVARHCPSTAKRPSRGYLEPAQLGNRRAAKHLAYATLTPAELEEVGAEEGAEAVAESGGHALEVGGAWDVVDDIPEDAAAAIVLLEHQWLIPLRDRIIDEGGIPTGETWVHPTDLVAIGVEAADEAEVPAAR